MGHGPNLAHIATRKLRSTQMSITLENQAITRTHKGKGIASFIVGVTCVIIFLVLIGTAGVMTQTGKLTPEISIIIGLSMFAACFVDLIGIGLGCFGAFDRSSKKTYPTLGLTLNIGILALFAVLLVIGLAMKGH
jgi:hypothetical protein